MTELMREHPRDCPLWTARTAQRPTDGDFPTAGRPRQIVEKPSPSQQRDSTPGSCLENLPRNPPVRPAQLFGKRGPPLGASRLVKRTVLRDVRWMEGNSMSSRCYASSGGRISRRGALIRRTRNPEKKATRTKPTGIQNRSDTPRTPISQQIAAARSRCAVPIRLPYARGTPTHSLQ